MFMRLGLLLVAFAASSLSASEVLEVHRSSGTSGYTEGELERINSGEISEIKKTGDGTLHSSGIDGFDGIIRVSGGVLKVTDATGLGTAAGKTVVEDGATLHFDTLSSGYTTYKSEHYEIAGNGFNTSPSQTNGAIRITGATCQLSHLTLIGDTSLYSGNGFHLYDDGNSGIDMGGNTLRFYSLNSGNLDVEWRLDTIENPGHIEIHNARYFVPEDCPFPGGSEHEVRLFGRTGMLLKSTAANKTWSILRFGDGGFYQAANNGCWNGPVENRNLASVISMTVGTGKTLVFNGPVRGIGGFLKDANLGTVVLNGENTFTSVFEVKGGTLVLGCPEAAAGSLLERFKFSNLTVAVGLTARSENWDCGWSKEEFAEVLESCRVGAVKNISVSLHAHEGDSVVVPVDFAGDYSAINVGAVAGGEVKCAASFGQGAKIRVNTVDPLVVARKEESLGCGNLDLLNVIKGTLILDDAGLVNIGVGGVRLGANNSSELAMMYVRNKTVLIGDSSSSAGYIALPECDVAGVGMYVEESAVVTNTLQFSIGQTTAAGALYVCGGEVFAPYTASKYAYIGGRGQGFIDVSRGRFEAIGPLHLGVFESGIGQLAVSGGVFHAPESVLHAGDDGIGTVYQCGGMVLLAALNVCSSANQSSGIPGYGAVTATGPETILDVAGNVTVNNRSVDSALGIMNISASATIKAANILKSANAGENARAFVNVDGGIVKVQKDNINLFSGIDKVTVYGGGITIDTDGHDITLAQPLLSPGAGGIASISLDVSKFTKIVTPPHILIEGDGEGASAVAIFDSATRTVKGVVVTSPGSGYTIANTKITAVYKGRVNTAAPYNLYVDCGFSISDTAAAGTVKLVKRGSGKLTLGEGVLPADSTLSVEGGSIGGDGLSFAEYFVTSGVAPSGTLDFWPEGSVLSIGNLAGLDETKRYVLLTFADSDKALVPPLSEGCVLPKGWCLKTIGNKLVLSHPRLFSLILK